MYQIKYWLLQIKVSSVFKRLEEIKARAKEKSKNALTDLILFVF